jgi:hypothetical protein
MDIRFCLAKINPAAPDLPIMKQLLIISAWLITTVFTLFSSLTLYKTITRTKGLDTLVNHELRTFITAKNPLYAYASLPTAVTEIRGAVLGADARPVTINAYLKYYHSPLEGTGEYLVETADQYNVDPYLIIAIAQQESNLCKTIPDDSYNCWGWGVHSQGTLRFDSFEQAIEAVTRGVKERYLDKGYWTPEQIMTKYAPLSDGSWASAINQFLAELNSGSF